MKSIRRLSVAAAAFVTGASGAWGGIALDPGAATSLYASSISSSERTTRAGFSEDFETFTIGTLGGQFAWQSSASLANVIPTGIEGFGERSAQIGVDFSAGIGGVGASPTFPFTFGIVAADFVLSDDPDFASTGFETADTVSGFPNTRVLFEPGGSIGALQAIGGMGVVVPTSGSWTENVKTQIGIEVLPGNVLNVYQDGALIFTGHDIPQQLGSGFAGLNRPILVQNFGGPTAIFDNVTDVLIPSPGALALFGLAGLAAARRRR